MMTATSTSPTPEVLPADEDAPRPRAPRKLSKGAMAIIVAFVAVVTAGVLLLGGVFDTPSSSDIKIDPVSNKPAVASTTAAPRPADAKVVVDYLAKMKSWNECMTKHAGAGALDACGDMPAQVDEPGLNAYLNDVLNWNKCAAPLLKRSAVAEAEAACGPQPAPPTGG